MLLKKIGGKVLAVFCIVALLTSGLTAGLAEPGYGATPEIGKKTSRSTYIKAEDWPEGPKVASTAAVLMDAQSGAVLYAKNPDTMLYPASITKIMTALIALEECDLKQEMTFTEEATEELPYNSVICYAEPGEKMTVEDCLKATLIFSANDAAAGLACDIAGNLKRFSKLMNKRAKELGCKNTHFNNPHGLPDDNHYTTAYDMCLIMKECVKYEEFQEIAGTKLTTIEKNNKRKQNFTFYTKHKMLFETSPYYYENFVCGKTGYTKEAVNTLVTYAEKDGRGLICVCMKAGYGVAYTDTKDLFEYGFKKFKTVNARKKSKTMTLSKEGEVQYVSEAETNNTVKGASVEINKKAYVTMPKGVKLSDLDMELTYLEGETEDNQASAESSASGEVDPCFGVITYKYQNTVMGTAKVKLLISPVESEKKEDNRKGNGTGGLIHDPDSNNISAQVRNYIEEIKRGEHQIEVAIVAGAILFLLLWKIAFAIRRARLKRKHKGHSYRVR